MFAQEPPTKSTWKPCQCSGCKRARENGSKHAAENASEPFIPTVEQQRHEIDHLLNRMTMLETQMNQLTIMYNDMSECLAELEQQVANMNASGTLLKGALLQAEPLHVPESYGWICPRCDAVWAPTVRACYCGDVQAADPTLHSWSSLG